MSNQHVSGLIEAARTLSKAMRPLRFDDPVAVVYNPLDYAWPMYEAYIRRYGSGPKRVVMVGMNPGPWGMAQTGVPFGEVATVRDWLRLSAPISAPQHMHQARPIHGMDCPRSEVSGRRLWGLFAERYGTPEAFFAEHLVLNYCPLVFMEASGRNRTPDKLPAAEREALFAACDRHLNRCVEILEPQWLVAVGGFARKRAGEACSDRRCRFLQVLHPSPANPRANRDWAGEVTGQLCDAGVWHVPG